MPRKRQRTVSVETMRKRNNARKSDSRAHIELRQKVLKNYNSSSSPAVFFLILTPCRSTQQSSSSAGINREQRKRVLGSPGQPWKITGPGLHGPTAQK
jgi:hypothetical protein